MSTLNYREKQKLEELFDMSSGYVLDFSDTTFEYFFEKVANIDIHAQKYQSKGTSKAKKLRSFWEQESDPLVGRVLLELISKCRESPKVEDSQLIEECQSIANRLLTRGPNLSPLTETAIQFDADYLQRQIKRMENAVESDPELAIGTAKELIETCCKTILEERGKSPEDYSNMPQLTKATFKELNITRDDVPNTKGAEAIKKMLSNLMSISNEINELRNLHGTGHGKTAKTSGLLPRHARLAVGSAATLVQYLFEYHTR